MYSASGKTQLIHASNYPFVHSLAKYLLSDMHQEFFYMMKYRGKHDREVFCIDEANFFFFFVSENRSGKANDQPVPIQSLDHTLAFKSYDVSI